MNEDHWILIYLTRYYKLMYSVMCCKTFLFSPLCVHESIYNYQTKYYADLNIPCIIRHFKMTI